jgi:WD40-like Beta Propeller Repeat/Lysyl oxidase
VRGGDVVAIAPQGTGSTRLTRTPANEAAPSLSPDGKRIAFVSDRDGNAEIYVMDTTGADVSRLTSNPARIDTDPAWSPDGRRIAYASGTSGELDLYVMNADGSAKRGVVVAPGDDAEPAWSPDGRQLAFASNRQGNYDLWLAAPVGGEPAQLTADASDEREPAWSPDGTRLAVVTNRDGNDEVYTVTAGGLDPRRLTADPASDRDPAWSPDARRVAFARSDAVHVVGAGGGPSIRIADGAEPHWGRLAPAPPPPPPPPRPPTRPQPEELLPDLDQRAPRGLVVDSSRRRFRLGFASAVDNIGRGPIWITGSRVTRLVPTMTATQLIRLSNGKTRALRNVGVLRYTHSASHSHWHLLRFQNYELRRADSFELVVRDRKSGFCLADHYGHAATRVRGFGPPVFRGSCGKGRPDLLWVQQGSSVGYTDRYPAHYHGQNVDVTGLAAGRYWLVHRANPGSRLRERTYANNAAAVLIRLGWPRGRRALPDVRVLRVCEGSERC